MHAYVFSFLLPVACLLCFVDTFSCMLGTMSKPRPRRGGQKAKKTSTREEVDQAAKVAASQEAEGRSRVARLKSTGGKAPRTRGTSSKAVPQSAEESTQSDSEDKESQEAEVGTETGEVAVREGDEKADEGEMADDGEKADEGDEADEGDHSGLTDDEDMRWAVAQASEMTAMGPSDVGGWKPAKRYKDRECWESAHSTPRS